MVVRKNIEHYCSYCAHSKPLDDEYVSCRKRGVVAVDYKCSRFKYDPLKRVPPKPKTLSENYLDSDFYIE
ncbi:MAG: hypothetical protein N2Z65_04500 [Clostridiales bacterium]|nr:hypothetical protein [Clostridiales bacterium]